MASLKRPCAAFCLSRLFLVAVTVNLLSAFGDSGGGPIEDATVPPDVHHVDVQTGPDTGPQQALAEIALADCPNWQTRDAGAACVARAPLKLTFVAVTSVGADSYLWDVGGGAGTLEGQVVEHTYH